MVRRLRRYREPLTVAFLMLSSFVFLGAILRPDEGRMLYGFDLERFFRPFGEFMAGRLQAGRLPLWNPYVLLGFPQYADPQLATFYPLTWLLSWLPVRIALPLQFMLHLSWAAVGGYVLLRRLGAKWAGSLLGGFVLAYAVTMTARIWLGQLPQLMTLAWLPWCLAAAHWAVAQKHWGGTLVAALPLAMAGLIGYIPYWLFLIFILAIFMGWLAGRAWLIHDKQATWRIIGQFFSIVVFGFFLAAVQLLPSFQYMAHSSSASIPTTGADSILLQLALYLSAVMPEFFGNALESGQLWLSNLPVRFYWEWAIYIGILPLIFFILAWYWGRKPWRFWLILGLIGVIMALASRMALLSGNFPGNWLPIGGWAVFIFGLSATIITGFMFDHWFDQPAATHERHAGRLRNALLIILPAGFFLIMLTVFWQAVQAESEQLTAATRINSQLVRLLILVAFSLVLLIWGYGRARWQLATLALVLLVVDLWGIGNKFITDVSMEGELGWVMADLALPDNRPEYRVLSEALNENGGYDFNLYSIGGHSGFMLESSQKLLDLARADARIARLLSGRYLLHGHGWEQPLSTAGWELLTQPAGVTIYAREDAGPRAFIVHDLWVAEDPEAAQQMLADPALDLTQTAIVQFSSDPTCSPANPGAESSSAMITAYLPEQVVIQTNAAATGWLILNDLYYPGWQATIDGEPAPIHPTNYALRGLCIPAGVHEVVFTFRPPVLRYGAILSALAFLVLAVASVFLVATRRQRKASDQIEKAGQPA